VHTKLLNRTTRRVTVTPDGAAYYERVVRLLGDLDELDGSMTTSQASPKGRIRVDVGTSVATLIVIPALPAFHARYPDIQIDLGVSDRPVDLVAENVDCVVRIGEIADQSLIARRIGEMRFMTVAAPTYLARYGEPLQPSDLEKGHHVVSFLNSRTGRIFPLSMRFGEQEIEMTLPYVVSTNDGNAYVAAVLQGMGIAQVPEFMVQAHLAKGELKRVLVEWTMEPLPVHVVYPPNRHLSNKLRVFVDWIADLFASHDLIQRRSSLGR
jgi:LysR family transcriptional regulator, regulator for bpeEF and oprC